MSESKHIKLRVPGESFWAIPLSEDTAEVDNILLDGSIGLGDVVKFNPANNEVVSVLVKKTNTMGIKYPTTGDIKETYKKVYEYLEENNIKVEGMMAGMALIAVPVGIPDSAVEKIISESPVQIELMDSEDDEE